MPAGPSDRRLADSAGTPQGAAERGNLLVAETTLRAEIPRPTLTELLELTALIAQKAPGRFSWVAARWRFKYLEAEDDATVYEASFVAASLQALGGRRHAQALGSLRDMRLGEAGDVA